MAISRPITRSTARNIVFRGCRALRFNGANNYGQLATRVIDPDGDIEIEWYQQGVASAEFQCIVSQSLIDNATDREFTVISTPSGFVCRLGGASITLPTSRQRADGLFRITFIGGIARLYVDNIIEAEVSFTRGSAREPLAATLICARPINVITNRTNFFNGLIPYIRINNQVWLMDQVGQAIQPSLPAGNDMTLFNVTPEQWEVIPCSLRP